MGKNKTWCLTEINFGPSVISPVEPKAPPVLIVDDTSILIMSPNTVQLQNDHSIVFEQCNKWHSLNFDRTYFIQIYE
jgi:hypothetical protein